MPQIVILTLQTNGKFKPSVYKGKLTFDDVKNELSNLALKRRIIKGIANKNEDMQDSTPQIKTLVKSNFEEIYNSNKMVLIHFKKDQDHPVWETIPSYFKGAFDYYEYAIKSISEENFIKKTLKISTFPCFKVIPIGDIRRKKSSNLVFHKIKKPETLGSRLVDHVPDTLEYINVDFLANFIDAKIANGKSPAIFLYNEDQEEELFYFKLYFLPISTHNLYK